MFTFRLPTFSAVAAAMLMAIAPAARAQLPADYVPRELQGVGVDQKLEQRIPLELSFKNEHGEDVTLGSLLKPERPVILTLNYFQCPMLCNLTLNGMVDGLNEVEWSAGKEFDIFTVSFDPEETPELAKAKKEAYLTQYRRETAASGWHFLTGTQENIAKLCDAVGFRYRLQDDGEYAHTSTIIFLTPDGRISLYMNDVRFAARDLRFALADASEGSIGSPMEHFLLMMCYQYDPESNSYAASAKKIMRLGGVLTVLTMITGFAFLMRKSPAPPILDAQGPVNSGESNEPADALRAERP